MSPTEIIYVFVLLSSVGFGQVIKYVKSPIQKQLISTCVGVVMVVGLCGWQTYHSVLSVAVTVAIIRGIGANRKCHLWSFAFNFTYLLLFRLGYLIGLSVPTGFSNVVQLLLTLRLVGISFEIKDSYTAKARARDASINHNQQNGKPRYEAIIQEPSIADICHYSYCYIGLFSGPYYTYKTYSDMLHCKNSHSIPTTWPIIEKLKMLVPLGAAYVALSFFKCSSAPFFLSEEFYSHGYFQRIYFTVVLVTAYRLRMYAAWLLAECVCISATLGAYPVSTKPKVGLGPSVEPAEDSKSSSEPVEYNYTTIQNIDWYHCESTTDFRSAMRYWNMTVQWWLKNYVYIRFPYRSWSTFVTFLVSGYWHGIHPGYFLCFLTTPMILIAEDSMRVFRRGDAIFWYDKVGWVMKCYTFQYVHMGFQLLGFWATMRHWASTYFLGHALTGFFLVVSIIFRPRRTEKKVE
ncbi:lysophospholipid acyltransferase 7-like [Patiria miniata]|uniref:Lysophospholipid acyltransferase 7 n=1 Tax=Patiria miniata TaxID=46514 RepID=A0A914AZE9_PATMI|nr:lysophospholipid acyltransferase 7-like [Patiria miniata]